MKKDLSGKNLLNCPDVFADIGNVNLFDGEPMIRSEDLERQSTELVYKDDYGTMRRHLLDIADHQVKVIHLAKQDPETRKKYQSDFRHIVDYLACARDRQECQNYIWDTERKICHPEEYLDMMAAFSSDTRFAQIRETIVKRMKEGEGEVTMFSIAEELENIGKEKGIEQGLKQGKEQTYYRMFRNHKTPEDISEFSGESLEYLCHIHEKYLELVQEESQYKGGRD